VAASCCASGSQAWRWQPLWQWLPAVASMATCHAVAVAANCGSSSKLGQQQQAVAVAANCGSTSKLWR